MVAHKAFTDVSGQVFVVRREETYRIQHHGQNESEFGRESNDVIKYIGLYSSVIDVVYLNGQRRIAS